MNSAAERSSTPCAANAARVALGLGGYALDQGGNAAPPIPTNQWYSSLFFEQWSQPLFALPLSYQPGPGGLALGLPRKQVIRHASRSEADIAYPHLAALTVRPLAFGFDEARAGHIGDWSLELILGEASDALRATLVRGSPFSYYRLSRGDAAIDGVEAVFWRGDAMVGLLAQGQPYALYLPPGAHWRHQDRTLTLLLPAGAGYFSLAALPQATPECVAMFGRHAYAFVTGTRAQWRYDEAGSVVSTTFSAAVETMHGGQRTPLLGLLPHQWHSNALPATPLPCQFDTVRGALKLVAAASFQTSCRYHGILPHWPALTDQAQAARLQQLIERDLAAGIDALLGGGGSYWQGKALGRSVQLMAIAEQQGLRAQAARLLAALKARMQAWLSCSAQAPGHFRYDGARGALVGYPDEYGSATDLNDHHFHYGYWIHAAAQIALRDPHWARADQWGGMVKLLIDDIANSARGDARFPYLRVFDPFESHSWASGNAAFADGNNQESSSEAIHAWSGLILWAEATADAALRETAVCLYASEVAGAQYYWFDLHGLVFAPEYGSTAAGIVWSGKVAHATWWTADPRAIHGINLLPVTPASLYLGRERAYVRRNLDAMDLASARYRDGVQTADGTAPLGQALWQDILLQYGALDDPHAALAQWSEQIEPEEGETRSHTYHWLQSLANLGLPEFGVHADTSLYTVLRAADGQLTYLAYNPGEVTRTVRFSDGRSLEVAPRSLGKLVQAPKLTIAHAGRPVHPQEHYENRLERARTHIELHLDQPVTLAELAATASFSPSHFHRVFCEWHGETPQAYIRRQRLERSAALLHYGSGSTIERIAASCGFTSVQAFNRAFRQYFNVTPSQWRSGEHEKWRGGAPTAAIDPSLRPQHVQLVCLAEVQTAYRRKMGPYQQDMQQLWEQSAALAAQLGLAGQACYGIGLDDPAVTPAAHCRFDSCIALPPSAGVPRHTPVRRIAGGLHAVLPYHGKAGDTEGHWRWLFQVWLPQSGYIISQSACFERYPGGVPAPGTVQSELCLPLARRP